MTVQIFVYKFIVYNEKKTHETLHILKIKKHFEREPYNTVHLFLIFQVPQDAEVL